MIIKILGLVDILAAVIVFLFSKFSFIPDLFMYVTGAYLIVKGLIFVLGSDVASVLDVISGLVVLVMAFYPVHVLIMVIVVFFLIQKGIFSLIS